VTGFFGGPEERKRVVGGGSSTRRWLAEPGWSAALRLRGAAELELKRLQAGWSGHIRHPRSRTGTTYLPENSLGHLSGPSSLGGAGMSPSSHIPRSGILIPCLFRHSPSSIILPPTWLRPCRSVPTPPASAASRSASAFVFCIPRFRPTNSTVAFVFILAAFLLLIFIYICRPRPVAPRTRAPSHVAPAMHASWVHDAHLALHSQRTRIHAPYYPLSIPKSNPKPCATKPMSTTSFPNPDPANCRHQHPNA